MSARQAAARLGVGFSSAIRWIARAKVGELAHRWPCRNRSPSLDVHEVFVVGLTEELKDIVHAGDVVIENLPAHKAAGVSNAVEAAGASEIQRYWREARFRPVSVPETYDL